MDALVGAIWSSAAAIGASALLFIAANRLFDLVVDRWLLFVAVLGALVGTVAFGVLVGNRSLNGPGLLWVIVGGVLVAAVAVAPKLIADRRTRLAVTTSGGMAIGVLLVLTIDEALRPSINTMGLLVFVAITTGIYLLRAVLWGQVRTAGLLVAAAVGWVGGSWFLGQIGEGSRLTLAVAVIVPTALAGAALGSGEPPTKADRSQIQRRTRVVAFLGPALLFVTLGLIVPLARTIYLSLHDHRGEELVGFKNYGEILTNSQSVDLSGWAGIFTSRLFFFGIGLLAVGALFGLWRGRQRGRVLEKTVGSITPMAFGGFLLAFAVFASLRGTVINNLWWVLVVTTISTSLGLVAAVLTDRVRFESVAKSLFFLPMAISFVGAGIIWKFMYIARPFQKPQTGTFNAIWVALGKLVPGSFGQVVGLIVLALLTTALGGLCLFGIRRQQTSIAVGAALSAVPVLWLAYRLLGPGLGGATDGPLGPVADPILFVAENPFNNIWLMVVLIWIQTGFAMVILSAAIKSVPSELIAAAKVDGATDQQVFFYVTLPTIMPTIIVIATALIVLVMKVFDIVRVMTNGNFGTQVIANEMWQRAFIEFNLGLGSALAAVLFLGVVPAMAFNVHRLQRIKVA